MSILNSPVMGPALLCFIISAIIVVAAVAVVLCVYFVYMKKHNFLKNHLGINSVRSRVQDAGSAEGKGGTDDNENATQYQFDKEYLKDALSQSTMQFYLSVFASLTGFALIIAVIIVALVQGDIEIALGTLPGVVINIVSALFFKQAKDTRDLAAALYGQNMHRINVFDGRDIANEIEDRKLKSIVLATIALNLASSSTNPAEEMQGLLKSIGDCSKTGSSSATAGDANQSPTDSGNSQPTADGSAQPAADPAASPSADAG